MNRELVVVAGEASGDRAAAAVLSRLPGVRAFGMGGGALARERLDMISDLRDSTALGVAEVARRAAGVALAYAKLRAVIAVRRPAAALLVNYTEFNTRLARDLWRTGTRVLWYGAPQIWAWRAGRALPLRKHLDRMAVMLPFEERLWRDLGVDAHYVGHPALEERRDVLRVKGDREEARASAREALGMTPRAWTVAVVPGSRPHEVRRLLAPMLEAYESVRRDLASVDGRVLLAPSLDDATRAWVRALAASYRIDVVDVDPRAGLAGLLPGFDVSLCASGTATLECALARAVPIVCYRVGWATEIGARAFVSTPHVALPNILIGRGAFPELLQRNASASRIRDALASALEDRAELLAACDEVEAVLGSHTAASHEVARMLEPWLYGGSRAEGSTRA